MKTAEEYTNWFIENMMKPEKAIVNGHVLISALNQKLEEFNLSGRLHLIERIGIECDRIITEGKVNYEEMEYLGMFVSDQYVLLSGEKPLSFKYYSPID